MIPFVHLRDSSHAHLCFLACILVCWLGFSFCWCCFLTCTLSSSSILMFSVWRYCLKLMITLHLFWLFSKGPRISLINPPQKRFVMFQISLSYTIIIHSHFSHQYRWIRLRCFHLGNRLYIIFYP